MIFLWILKHVTWGYILIKYSVLFSYDVLVWCCDYEYVRLVYSLSYYTGCTRKNGAVSKVNKKFIFHHTRAQRTPSAAAAVQVSHALPAVRFSCLLRGQFPRCRRSRKRLSVCSVLRCPDLWLQCMKRRTMHGASFLNGARNSRCTVITDLDTSKRSTQKAFSCCDAILETGPAAPQ